MLELKEKLRGRKPLLGTFVKTASPAICETVAYSDFDLICLDAEHAPFDRSSLDQCVLACRAADLPVLIRLPSNQAEHIQHALDIGATGIIAPHIMSGEDAKKLADLSLYHRGRGFAGGTRAAQRKSMTRHVEDSNQNVVIIAQIEDAAALNHLDSIFAVEEIDAFFIGRSDLTISYGLTDPNHAQILDKVEKICLTGEKYGRAVGMFTGNLDEISKWRNLGVSLFLLSSDQALMLEGAARLNSQVRQNF